MTGGKDNPFFNASGYPDPTAYYGVKNIVKQDEALDNKVNFLIKVLKFIIRESGFELMNRIEIRDQQTGRVFK